ncbi:MAG: LapA family protein [Alphaproteobacteria bacterium]
MKILWRYFSWLFSIPLLAFAICFSVGNREPTIISLWPFDIELALPIYLLALVPLACGLIFGAGMQWFVDLRHRVAAQRLGKEVARLKADIATLKAEAALRQISGGQPPAPSKNPLKLIAGLRAKS